MGSSCLCRRSSLDPSVLSEQGNIQQAGRLSCCCSEVKYAAESSILSLHFNTRLFQDWPRLPEEEGTPAGPRLHDDRLDFHGVSFPQDCSNCLRDRIWRRQGDRTRINLSAIVNHPCPVCPLVHRGLAPDADHQLQPQFPHLLHGLWSESEGRNWINSK